MTSVTPRVDGSAGEQGGPRAADAPAAAFLDVERLGFFSVSPDGTRVAYVSDADGRFALWIAPLDESAPAVRRWSADLDIDSCVWRPDGARILVKADAGGTENYQLAEVDPTDGTVDWLTDAPDVQHHVDSPYCGGAQPYSPDSTLLAYASNARDRSVFDVIVRDLRTGQERTVLTGDDRYFPKLWSPDGTRLLVLRLHQNTEHDLFVCDLASGGTRQVTGDRGTGPHRALATHVPISWAADGRGFYLLTSQGREFAGLAFLDLTTGGLQWLAEAAGHDLVGAAVSADEQRLVWSVNVDGFSELHVRDVATGIERLVTGLPRGVVATSTGLDCHVLTLTGDTVVVLLDRATAPAELCTIDLSPPAAASELATAAVPLTACGARVPGGLVEPESVRFTSADGASVQALLYRPTGASADAPMPVVLSLHGGPEAQELPVWGYTNGLYQYLLSRGVGVLAPNVRGSSGFGLSYQRSIYRRWGEVDLCDFTACVDFLRTLDWVDGARLGVFGASYGGFATLTCLARMPAGTWSVGVDLFGPSDQATDARTMPPHWQNRVADWIGDPDDPDEARRMAANSPLTHADRIDAPLLVIQGANDARVAKIASDTIVERLRELDRPVEYIVLHGDGHGFGARSIYVAMMSASADWLLRYLR